MRIIAKRTLREFWKKHPDAETRLLSWYRTADKSDWDTPNKVKESYGNASNVGNNRMVFDICGNRYRLVVKIDYSKRTIFVRFLGTHAEYDKINAKEV